MNALNGLLKPKKEKSLVKSLPDHISKTNRKLVHGLSKSAAIFKAMGFSHDEHKRTSVEQAEDHYKRTLMHTYDDEGNPVEYPLSTSIDDLELQGGVWGYYMTIKWLAWLYFVISILSIPNVVFFSLGETYAIPFPDRTMIGNLGYKEKGDIYGISREDIGLLCSIMDLICRIVFVYGLVKIQGVLDKHKATTNFVTPNMFSVRVRAFYVLQHFWNHLSIFDIMQMVI
jgi:hypothetical protein